MDWNDHVEFVETECLDCGVIDTWQHWDAVGKVRYIGQIGQLLNVDASRSGQCPHCGSVRGRQVS